MRAEDTLQFMADFYPSIFPTRKHCLNHLFCTIGNGYRWVKGELVEDDDKKYNRYRLLTVVAYKWLKHWVCRALTDRKSVV